MTMRMHRFVSLLLIPVFVLGQPLPHSHAGMNGGESEGHSQRPHFHLSVDHHHGHTGEGHHHHHHHHPHEQGDPSELHAELTFSNVFSIPVDHDSDAVYLADTDWTVSRTVSVPVVNATIFWIRTVRPIVTNTRADCRQCHPPDRDAGLPVYLLTASLRL